MGAGKPCSQVQTPLGLLPNFSNMIVVDTVARTLTPAEIPLGVLTAIIGAPIFGILLRRTQRKGWEAWACPSPPGRRPPLTQEPRAPLAAIGPC